ncbi:MAG: alpha/beta fold hydrolase [Acidimicrobiales bacterium]
MDIGRIEISVPGDGELVFDALAAGPDDGPLVLLLHGFPQSSGEWRSQLAALAGQGYRAVAPDQRGYSPGARPDGVDAYRMPLLVGDVLAMADELGAGRFHLVGHDWGAAVAWYTAAAHPDRLLSLTAVSVPHPMAFAKALASPSGDQAERSSYMAVFQSPEAEGLFAGEALRAVFAGSGHSGDVTEYVERMAEPGALTAALNWYRAMDLAAMAVAARPVSVPTLFVWSSADIALGREAAEDTGSFVTGPYRFEVLDDVSHWVPEEAPDILNRLLLEHLGGRGTSVGAGDGGDEVGLVD